MRRGDIHTVAGGKDYAGKPRPVAIVQDDSFDATYSITICAFTTDATKAPLFRIAIEPNARNGLRGPSCLMVDKITTVPKSKIGAHRPPGRQRYPASQPRRLRLPRIGRLSQSEEGGVSDTLGWGSTQATRRRRSNGYAWW